MAIRFTLTRILPSLLLFLSVLAGAMLVDFLLHAFKLVWIGRYCGVAGTILILLSLLYSLRKRRLIQSGSASALLKWHEVLGMVGPFLLIVHGGIHFYALIPWLALFAMLIVVASGLTGRFLLAEAQSQLKGQEAALQKKGLTKEEAERELLGHALLLRTMQQWRRVHMPLTMVFLAFSLLHISSTLLFWRW